MLFRTALLLGLAAAGTASAKDIRLKNPGFEEPATVHDVVSGWRALQHSGEDAYEFTTVGDIQVKGKRSFRLTRIKEQHYGALDQAVPAAPIAGRRVEFRFQLRTENVGPDGFYPYINLTSSTGDVLDQVLGEKIEGTVDKWKTVKVAVTVPHDVHNVVIGLLLKDAGTIWADDVSLRTIEDEAGKPAPKPEKSRTNKIMIP
ncbi:MAG TPA: hypothetical protein VLF18_04205 [Tahibacter sp.]|uniref:hypothetical protein n=1 Tax=Tahibacter sp. TaxID=2056211 RepID=UPI002C270A57|nr:hypothetical protein [Tahibacter sp.]HSX59386.1 hypothetical protein [Tahibacter sp.]